MHVPNASVLYLAVVAVIASCGSAVANDTDSLEKFLRDNVMNRTVTVKGSGVIADNTVAFEFQRDMTYCNLVRSSDAISFDVVSIIKQRNQDVDADGNKQGEPRVKDRILVIRYELGRKQSTGQMLGFSRLVSTTMGQWRGYAGEITVELKDGSLLLTTKTVGYDDYFDIGGAYFPGASETVEKFDLVDGKLHVETIESKTLRIDPENGATESVKADSLPDANVETAKLPLD